MCGALNLKYLPYTETVYEGSLEDLELGARQGHPVAHTQISNMSNNAMPVLNDPTMIQNHMITTSRITLVEFNMKEILDELIALYPGKTNSEIVRNLIEATPKIDSKKSSELEKFLKQLYFIMYYQSALFLSRFSTYSEKYSLLHNMFKTEHLPELSYSISPQIAFKMLGPFGIHEPVPDYDLAYVKVRLDLQKYLTRTPFLFSDYYKDLVSLNPYAEDQIARIVAKKHNESSFAALKEIQSEKCLDVEKFEKNDTNDTNQSNNSLINEIRNIINSYRTEDSTITHIAMSVKLFNYFTEIATSNPANMIYSLGGLRTFPGIPHITAVVDPLLDNEDDGCMMYAVDKVHAIYGQGPIIMRSYYNDTRDEFSGGFFEYFQYKIIHKADLHITDDSKQEFAFKIKVLLPTSV